MGFRKNLGKGAKAIALTVLALGIASCSATDDGATKSSASKERTLTAEKQSATRMDNSLGAAGGVPAGVGNDPLSSVVAVYTQNGQTMTDFVKSKVSAYKNGEIDVSSGFPLKPEGADEFRLIDGLDGNVLVSWMQTISADGKKFGANNDYIAYFGDGHGGNPLFNGDGSNGWLWSNHEYLSATPFPAGRTGVNNVPGGQHMTLAKHFQAIGVLPSGNLQDKSYWTESTVETFTTEFKKQLGGSWLRVTKTGGKWAVDPTASGQRYDATSDTLFTATGSLGSTFRDTKDSGGSLSAGVVAGTLGNCSGGTSPWGTIFSAEENSQDYYGDTEANMAEEGRWYRGKGFDQGAYVDPDVTAESGYDFTQASNTMGRHRKYHYGYATEVDPGVASSKNYNSSSGEGHAKHTALGRARWENFTFFVGGDWNLINGKPLVIYYADDRRGGRVHKFVSSGVYSSGMSKAQVRNLLSSGKIYVSHLPGVSISTGYTMTSTGKSPSKSENFTGKWIEMSLDNTTDTAPNAGVSGSFKAKDGTKISYNNAAGTKVGAALQDVNWNGIGGFDAQEKVMAYLFTAEAKLGIFEQNRPEDVEFNAVDKNIYVAYTYHGSRVWLNQKGGFANGNRSFDLNGDGKAGDETRSDTVGFIWALRESNVDAPESSTTFQFWEVAHGGGAMSASTPLNFARPDNILLTKGGDIWFGTDGQYASSKGAASDAVYYLDINGSTGKGTAYRVVGVPSDAETTGPALNSDMTTLFLSVQHPGEEQSSKWPTR